jgi:hypothetical protein
MFARTPFIACTAALAVAAVLAVVTLFAATPASAQSSGETLLGLDFDLYLETVEPVFLNRRPGNARCVACHSSGGGNAFLEPLPPGRETWDEEQSFRNFERVQRLVAPGEPLASVLLVNPWRRRRAAVTGTPAASTGTRRTTRSGRPSPAG